MEAARWERSCHRLIGDGGGHGEMGTALHSGHSLETLDGKANNNGDAKGIILYLIVL